MKSDFLVAINQVCHERQLPPEVVLEAVEVALVSAYKRNYGSNKITARVDRESGGVKIYVEKEVVEEVVDDENQITLSAAKRVDPEVSLGDIVQIENTPANFGRIAAQTTKQVILQRIREAEREALYRTYAEREGEIVNGTVHKIDPHQVILSLGKVEAILPRAEQIPAEKYTAGQRLRAYVSEVSRTPRGPQILVSRTHRNMLRRLLEVEVPEIYNGTVEIKAIAREAGYRSKIAVSALQEGVDPVGSCVGMRGVRIQSIVNELGGEKIDVAEWSPDTTAFIANALSPAKVLNVLLQDIGGDKTASVVVPDKQLSLAIGKEGQNARLAAKLTGWRIDIKSVIEAVRDAMTRASASQEIKDLVSHRPEIFAMVAQTLEEYKEGDDLPQGELKLMSQAIDLIGQVEITLAKEKYALELVAREAALATQAEATEEELEDQEAEPSLEDDDILAKAQALLGENDEVDQPDPETTTETEEASAEVESEPTEDEIVKAALEVIEPDTEAAIEEEEEQQQVEEKVLEVEPVVPIVSEDFIPSILDTVVEEEPKKEPKKRIKPIVVVADEDPLEEQIEKRKKSKGRTLEYDENLGKVVVKRRRKKSRARDEWEDYID